MDLSVARLSVAFLCIVYRYADNIIIMLSIYKDVQ